MNKYSDLTGIQKKLVSNGCGAKKFIKPPEIKEFISSCDQHDYYYIRGGSLRDKVKADVLFFGYLMIDVAKIKNPFKMLTYAFIVRFYFLMVSIFGHFAFNYTKQPLTNKEILTKGL